MPVSLRLLIAILALRPSLIYGFTTSPVVVNRNHHQDRHSSLQSHPKNAQRAHIERNLEEAMDNDWRVFRARLVAKEKLELQDEKKKKKSKKNAKSSSDDNDHSAKSHSSSAEDNDDPKLQRQAQLSDLFAGALSSIFKPYQQKTPPEPSSDTSIFAGDTVGGAHCIPTKNSKNDGVVDNEEDNLDVMAGDDDNDKEVFQNEDPFASDAELPLRLPHQTLIDKHRWAHEIPYIEPGAVLVANEKLGGVFHQTVVLVVEHHETTGTFGIVINRPMEGNLMKVGSKPKAKVDLSLKMAFHNSRVAYGGPVLTDELSVLHSFGEVEGARKLCSGVYIGGSEELMMQVRLGSMDPRRALFVKGHAAWVPGQLNREIQKGVWYTAAVSSDLILRYAGVELTPDDNPNDLWTDILTCVGGKFEEIARRHGGTGDSRRVMP